MKTDQPATQPLNTVQTVFSQHAVTSFEYALHWFWDEVDYECFTDRIMRVLATYIKACPEGVHPIHRPDQTAGFISGLIQLNARLVEIIDEDRVREWVDTMEGWRKPIE